MFFTHLVVAVSCLVLSAFAIAIQPPLVSSNPTLSSPLALPSDGINASYGSIVSKCDADRYGRPSVWSCQEAYRHMSDDDRLAEFGDRARRHYDYPLPIRFTGG